ncbi:MAG: hypothetical protein M3Y23_02480 [Actinomycetota bacterium]|nr:hypothetical protein [Actinomycetota bacterium]
MDQFLAALLASAITATAALGGVWLANRAQRARHRETLRAAALAEQRDLVARAIIAGRAWCSEYRFLLPLLERLISEDPIGFANGAQLERIGARMSELHGTLTRATMVVADPQLHKKVMDLAAFATTFGSEVTAPAVTASADATNLKAAFRSLDVFSRSLDELQDLAVERLGQPSWVGQAS